VLLKPLQFVSETGEKEKASQIVKVKKKKKDCLSQITVLPISKIHYKAMNYNM
jgi:hypothetical protein